MSAPILAIALLFGWGVVHAEQETPRSLRVQPLEVEEGADPSVGIRTKFLSVRPRRQLRLDSLSTDWDGRGAKFLAASVGVANPPPIQLQPWPRLPAPPTPVNRIPPGFSRPGLEFAPSSSELDEANGLVDGLRDSPSLSPEEKRDLLAQWAVLAKMHLEVVRGQEVLVSDWQSLDLERKFDRFAGKYWSLVERFSQLDARYASYQTYCSRQVPPDSLEGAIRECNEIKRKLDSEFSDLQVEDAANVRLFNEEIKPPWSEFNARAAAHNTKYDAWFLRLQEFTKTARETARSSGKPSHISIHVQPDGQQGSSSWLAGSTQANPTRLSAQTLLQTVVLGTRAALGNRPPNLKGFEAAMAKQQSRLATYMQPSGRKAWTEPFGDRGQFRLDLEIVGEYPYTGTSP